MTLYPEFALRADDWLDSSRGKKSVAAAVLRQSDAHGLLRGSDWVAGQAAQPADPREAFASNARNGSLPGAAESSTSPPSNDSHHLQESGLITF